MKQGIVAGRHEKNNLIIEARGGGFVLLSVLLLVAILLARSAPNHSPALKRYFDVQFMATAAIETFGWLFGWRSEAYTVVYDFFTLFAFAASAGVVWEAWKTSASSQKASPPLY